MERGYQFELLDIDIHEYEDDYIEEYIQKNRYDFILLGSIVTHYSWMKWFVNMAKGHQADAQILVGNSVASSIPELFLDKTQADVLIMGEGEVSAYEAVEALRTGQALEEVQGIAFRKDGQCHITDARKAQKIDEFSMINWDFFDVERYIQESAYAQSWGKAEEAHQVRSMPVCTARGCAFKCTFCHYVFWNDPYRHRSPESILAEIKQNIEKYDANYISFWDDLSFASAKQAERIADAILESGLKFDWNASIRVDLFSRNKLGREESIKIAQKMKDSGCLAVGFSLESGNQEILEMMNKRIQANEFLETVEILREVGIVSNTSVVFGYPIETRESIRETFTQCLKARLYPSIGFLLPLPSTGMYEYAKQHDFITDEDAYLESITERQDICLNMTKLSDEEIMEEIKLGAQRLNEMLELGLSEESYIRTGRYQGDKAKPLDPRKYRAQ